ncbi:MAG: serine/threonine-protein phosphatase [Gemmatimonadetes bacterium]|nr:serine/threonine-protein phosphatase [Gemmatimonadota bacterium]
MTARSAPCACFRKIVLKGSGAASERRSLGYPLGVRPDTQYEAIEAQLHEGDYLVLYSDGIPETINPSEEMFGYDRTIETVREACTEGISAEDLVERLMSKAREFAGEEPQADDMTCVVVRVEA